ncbi:hypothetical protein EIN_440370 [Entamoeba invadens IP1]|uniref:Uncharacterized protein n=1 Tax=Entamoeba invadens IP1 TaxID=370355 RepID=A0A0A1TZE4_ENTIV|nr:hypothetical protein EIN_440370 [Entamoeba invadens IP1]ELP83893.1 hypothetical protein EIN_440370 [Entamoeba invadens IP1]|eukprot:XP_004183239.1 hypothetical protein EIN_440370 [Entamoeba invadens IP1]
MPQFDCVFNENNTNSISIEELKQRNKNYEDVIKKKVTALEGYYDRLQEAILQRKNFISTVEKQKEKIEMGLSKIEETKQKIINDLEKLSKNNDDVIYEILKAKKKSKDLKLEVLKRKTLNVENDFKATKTDWEQKLVNTASLINEKNIKEQNELATEQRISSVTTRVPYLSKRTYIIKQIEKHSKTTFSRVEDLSKDYCFIYNLTNNNGYNQQRRSALLLFVNSNWKVFGAFISNQQLESSKSFLFKIENEKVIFFDIKKGYEKYDFKMNNNTLSFGNEFEVPDLKIVYETQETYFSGKYTSYSIEVLQNVFKYDGEMNALFGMDKCTGTTSYLFY